MHILKERTVNVMKQDLVLIERFVDYNERFYFMHGDRSALLP